MEAVFKTILQADDPLELTDQECMHVPVIELPETAPAGEMFALTVKVGRAPHVMGPGHYIQFIDLYAGETFLSRVTFTPTAARPKITQYMVLEESAKLRAVAFCSLHGFWAAERWISVA